MDDRLVQKALDYLEGVESFIVTEAPDVIQQTLRYALISDWIEVIGIFILMTFFISLSFYTWFFPSYDKYGYMEIQFVLGRMISSAGVIFSSIAFVSCIQHLIKLYIAPKLFLIQYFLNMRS
jgi:hypothetical protein